MRHFLLQPFTDVFSKRSSHGESVLELDGLRGFAVLIVLASHTAAFGMYGQGSLGVLLFFYLSGYVLNLPFVEQPERIRQKGVFLKYALNRVLRIVPIYWLACVLIYFYTSSPNEWLISNVSFIKGWGHFWSVAEEVRFYLLFPFVLLLFSLFKKRWIQVLVTLCLVVLFYEIKALHKIDMMDGRKVNFYFWMFLGGVLASQISYSIRTTRFVQIRSIKWLIKLLAILCVALLVLTSKHYFDVLWRPIFPSVPRGYSMNGWRLPELWFFLFLILFVSLSAYRDSILNKLFQSYFLRHIGLLSYSIYLFHMNVMFVMASKGFKYEGLFWVVFFISYMIAYMSYIFVEKPFLKMKRLVK